MIKLRECPFCGSKMIDVILISWNPKRYTARCPICNAYGPSEHETVDQAAKAWNQRKGEKENEN